LLLAMVLGLAALPFWLDARSEARTPTGEDLGQAVAAVRAKFEDGDAVRVEPSWWTLPWQGLVGMGEGTEMWPFPALLSSEALDPVEALGARRLFVVAGFGREPERPALLGGGSEGADEIFRSETVAVALYENEPMKRLRTMTKEWERLRVGRRWAPGEELKRCPFKTGKHRCGRDGWMDVAPEPRVVAQREVMWLFAHPGPPETELELAWDGLEVVTEKGPTWVYLRVGPSLEAVRHPEGDDVVVQTLVDGVVVDEVAVAPRHFEMERRAISLAGRGVGESGTVGVAFRIKTTDQAWRETLIEADLLDGLPDALRAWATGIVE
jgi:hypothetical protein